MRGGVTRKREEEEYRETQRERERERGPKTLHFWILKKERGKWKQELEEQCIQSQHHMIESVLTTWKRAMIHDKAITWQDEREQHLQIEIVQYRYTGTIMRTLIIQNMKTISKRNARIRN